MGAERTQKGAVGQQLAASGKARRAEKIRRDEAGRGNIGKDVARGVMEDRMSRNDKEGKQKQGKSGRPGKPIDGRPPMMGPLPPKKGGVAEDYMPPIDLDVRPLPSPGRPDRPPIDTGFEDYKEIGGRPPKPPRDTGGRPPKPPRDTGGRPFPPKGGRPPKRPIRGDDQYGPGRPIGDDQFPPSGTRGRWRGGRPLPGFPGRPPGEGYLPGRPPFKGPRRGGTDFGPGRGDRLPEGPTKGTRHEDTYFNKDRFNQAKDMLNQPGGEKMLREFMEKLRSGGIR